MGRVATLFPEAAPGTNAPAGTGVPLTAYCALDGVTDDAPAFLAAKLAAAAAKAPLIGSPGKTMLIGSGLSLVTSGQTFDAKGMTIKKSATCAAVALTVSGADCEVIDLVIDGNRAAGATSTGLFWTGARGKATRVTSSHNAGNGISVQTGDLDASECVTNDNFDAGAAASDGFRASNAGVLRQYNCRASDNAHHGVAIQANAGAGCRVDCESSNNGFSAVDLLASTGTLTKATGSQNNQFGLSMTAVTGWKIGWVHFTDTGLGFTAAGGHVWAANAAATATELFGCTLNEFAQVIATRPFGYGLAITKNPTGGAASAWNTFGMVSVDYMNSPDQDPAIHFSGGAHHNHIGVASVRWSSYGVIFGEGTTPTTNDYNTIDALVCEKTYINAARFDAGSFNEIGLVVAHDVPGNATYLGVVSFVGANVVGNRIGELRYNDTGLGVGAPAYLAYADANATLNEVLAGPRNGFGTASHLDNNGSNVFFPRAHARPKGASTFATVPGVALRSPTTNAYSANTRYDELFHCDTAVTISNLYAEVTTGPAADGHLRMAIYRANVDGQPKGAPLTDQEIAVAAASTGVKTATVTLTLPAGRYVKSLLLDQAMTLRVYQGDSDMTGLATTFGATPFNVTYAKAFAYAAFPTNPAAWDTVVGSSNVSYNSIWFKVSIA